MRGGLAVMQGRLFFVSSGGKSGTECRRHREDFVGGRCVSKEPGGSLAAGRY